MIDHCAGCMGPLVHIEMEAEWQQVCQNIGCSDSLLYLAPEYMDDVDWSPSDYE